MTSEEVGPMEDHGLFMIRLCSDGAAYEAVPKRRLRLDIPNLGRSLTRRGDCELLLSNPQFMVVKWKHQADVTIVDDGRMIIRNAADQGDARTIAETLLPDACR